MFRRRRRYLLFFVSTILPLASLVVGIYLKKSNPTNTVIGSILLGVFILSCIGSYYAHIQPFRELSSAVVVLLDCVGQRIIDCAVNDGIEARLNYLAIFQPAWPSIFIRRYFRVAWGLGMKYQPDNTAEFHISKGVAGRAVKDRRETLVNIELPRNRNFGNFSSKEVAVFPEFTAIWSVPIFELTRAGDATGKILGTINLDSTARGAWHVFSGNPEYQRLLHELQDLVSKVASC